jgi:hypothetical protein
MANLLNTNMVLMLIPNVLVYSISKMELTLIQFHHLNLSHTKPSQSVILSKPLTLNQQLPLPFH